MNDDLSPIEKALTAHRLASPTEDLRRRIAALPRTAQKGLDWPGIAAAILAVLALTQIIASTSRLAIPHESPIPRAAIANDIHQLNLPLSDQQTRQLVATLAAGAHLQRLPELHGTQNFGLSPGDMP